MIFRLHAVPSLCTFTLPVVGRSTGGLYMGLRLLLNGGAACRLRPSTAGRLWTVAKLRDAERVERVEREGRA